MLSEFNICNIDPQSYLLLKEGLKPVIRVGLTKENVKKAEKLASELGLNFLAKEFNQIYEQDLKEPLIIVYYSLDKKLCREAWIAERDGDRKKLGELLGYPECCVNSFIKSLHPQNDLTMAALKSVKAAPSFYCNNLFVYDSKLKDTDRQKYLNNPELFLRSDVIHLFLIQHVPCSFDCKRSIEIGKTTLELLKNNFQDLAERVLGILKNPVLYWNYFEWIILNGCSDRGIIRYKGILDYDSLVEREIKRIVENGNRIEIKNDKILISGDNKTHEIQTKNSIPVCIDFK